MPSENYLEKVRAYNISSWFGLLVHIGALFPLAWLIFDAFSRNLTANPIQSITLRTGKAGYILLILTLACTPLHILTGYKPILKQRRTLGLYSFGYAALHFLIFVGLDYRFNLTLIYEAIFEKRYAVVGFAAGLILLILAITSTKRSKKNLGKRWKMLHRLVYIAGILAAIHYVWLVKSDLREPLAWGGLVLLLLFVRFPSLKNRLSQIRFRLLR